jgi:hypothetical protein
MKIVFVFRNGFQLCVTCEEFTLEKTVFGIPDGYKIKGITDNKPLYINWDDVICVYRDLTGEQNESDPDPEDEE